MKHLISIVIINKNDRAITQTLEACRKLEGKNRYEVIVVDSSEGTLDDIAKVFPSVQWIAFVPNRDKPISIPEQRNVGVRAANGDIIVFIDANCVPQPNWLTELLQPILEEQESIIVAGNTISLNKETTHDYIYKANQSNLYLSECPTINLAFTRELYDEIGGFDERFDYGSDIDFSWRVIDAGFKIRYQASAVISHDWGSQRQEFRRSFLYGKARTRLYFKHKKVKKLLTNDITLLIYPLFILGLPLSIIWLWYPLLLLVPLIKNYNKKPLATVTDHLIYALGVLEEILVRPIQKNAGLAKILKRVMELS